jgi:hypothetical protein
VERTEKARRVETAMCVEMARRRHQVL